MAHPLCNLYNSRDGVQFMRFRKVIGFRFVALNGELLAGAEATGRGEGKIAPGAEVAVGRTIHGSVGRIWLQRCVVP